MPRKLNFFICLLDTTFQTPIPYSSTTHSYHLPTLKTFGLSSTQNLNWKLHISSLNQSASSMLGILYRLRQFLSPAQLLSIYRGLVRPRMEYASHVWEGAPHTQLSWTEWSLRLFVSAVLLLSQTVFSLLNSAAMLLLSLSSIVIFTLLLF